MYTIIPQDGAQFVYAQLDSREYMLALEDGFHVLVVDDNYLALLKKESV